MPSLPPFSPSIPGECSCQTRMLMQSLSSVGAQLRHLHTYTRVYAKLFPDATQILIRCNPSAFWTSLRAAVNILVSSPPTSSLISLAIASHRLDQQHARMYPVIQTLQALGCLQTDQQPGTTSRPRVLTHVFSNGPFFLSSSLCACV